MKNTLFTAGVVVASTLCLSLTGCEDAQTPASSPSELGKRVKLQDHSVTPVLVMKKDLRDLDVYSLISSNDTLEDSPNFIFGGSADGLGLLRGRNGKEYTIVVNHEDNFSVSRIALDDRFKPVEGEYLLNSDNGRWRLCSATLATMAEHGFDAYLTCGESGEESMTHAIDPMGPIGQSNPVAGFGRWSAENAVPLPKEAYRNKTVVLIGDDDSETYGGQLAMYVSNTVGDLNSGRLYVLARKDNNTRERDMVVGQKYEVAFREIPNATTMTGAQINAFTSTLSAMKFGRTEDIDYRKKGEGREIYFNVTGQNTSGANADFSRTKYGRTYRLILNESDPTKGTLEVILDGDDRNGPARTFQNPDNICVTENYVYIQEDPNGYGDETHDAYLYQYKISNGNLKVVFELDHHRNDPKYNVGGPSRKGAWEYGALVDISDQIKIDDAFLLCVQPHTWTGARYRNPDGGTTRPNESQASQILVVKGLDR